MTEPVVQLTEVPASAAGRQRVLPFTYAKQNGVLLDFSGEQAVVVHQGTPGIEVLTVLRRFLG